MKKNEDWDGKSRGGAFGYAFFIFLIRHAGIRMAYAFLSVVVIYFIPFAPKATKAVWFYNRHIRKYGFWQSLWKLYAHYYVFGQTLIDKMACKSGLEDRYGFDFENYEDFLQCLDAGPVIIIGAHVGCWEIGAAFFGKYASKLNVVLYDGEDKKIKGALQKMPMPYKVIELNEGGISSLLKMKILLDKGEYVCFQGDRYMETSPVLTKDLMGRLARLPQGPFVLAAKFKVPVVFYFAMRERGMRYAFHFTELKGCETVDSVADAYVDCLEHIMELSPPQWYNFYNQWN